MKESKVFIIKEFNTGKTTNLRKITFVCRQKQFFEKNTIGLWWKKSLGLGVIDRPNRQLKYFMIGIHGWNLSGLVGARNNNLFR